MKPTVGRIVHYHTSSPKQGGKPYAAIITAVDEGELTLSVMTPTGGRFNSDMSLTPGRAGEDVMEWWEWPPRE